MSLGMSLKSSRAAPTIRALMSNTPLSSPLRELRDRMASHLQGFTPIAVDDEALRRAAVAIVVVASTTDSNCAEFLLTRRGGQMRRHSGQWALPGGRTDGDESASQTARRELAEELGVELGEDDVLGVLDDFPTRSGFAVTPVVIWGGRIDVMRPDPEEVEAVYRIPLSDLEHADVPQLESIPESCRPVLSIPFASLNQTVYAPTAAMIYQFREVALHGRATRVADYEQPVFAWR
ncbi:MAG: 8-oxo-dGTP pyrophosphatase MutT (NUDIX family) [Gammaproteobacteria bacterium]|jgi:8-oxo-dGTP pyrophosphatase MutT (NUDIX family)